MNAFFMVCKEVKYGMQIMTYVLLRLAGRTIVCTTDTTYTVIVDVGWLFINGNAAVNH